MKEEQQGRVAALETLLAESRELLEALWDCTCASETCDRCRFLERLAQEVMPR